MTARALHTRGLTAFFVMFGFLVMSVTGLVLYVVPAGRVAYWTNWMLIDLTKTDWSNIHILSSILFIVAGAVHTYLNWRSLLNYMRNKASHTVKLGRELVISSTVTLLLIVSAVYTLPPLSYLIDFSEFARESWVVEEAYEPPFGHAELLSLKVFAQRMDIDLAKAVTELRANGIIFDDASQTLEEIGEINAISPMNVYLLIRKFEPRPEPEKLASYTPESIEMEFAGTGIGNKTLGAVCERLGLDPAVALERLAGAAIATTTETTLKSIAENADADPIEIMKTIILQEYRPTRTE